MAIDLAIESVKNGGGPFGALIVKGDQIIATGTNLVTIQNDPTAHAEIIAIRRACEILGSFQLDGCEIYASCEPCPMCLGAIYWARPSVVYFAATNTDAARAGFDDAYIYQELARPYQARALKTIQVAHERANESFDLWKRTAERIEY